MVRPHGPGPRWRQIRAALARTEQITNGQSVRHRNADLHTSKVQVFGRDLAALITSQPITGAKSP